MATVVKTFDAHYGVSVANTIVLSNASGVLNISNVTMMNVNGTGAILNVSQNTVTGNLTVIQNVVVGNISVTGVSGANLTSLNVSANISNTGNLLVTQNTFTGNLSVTTLANVTTLNVSSNANVSYLNVQNLINTSSLNVSVNANVAALNVSGLANVAGSLNVAANIANTGNLLVTQNTFTGNLSVTTNAAIGGSITVGGNATVTSNITAGNLSVSNITTTGQGNVSAGNATFSGAVSISGNLLVTGTTITLNATSVTTNDQYIMLASNNFGDSIDSGFATLSKNTTQANVYSGLIKHAADETWHLFEGYALMNAYPATINIAQTNVATLNANIIAQQITLGAINVNTWIGSAYSSANLAYTAANNAYLAANAAQTEANLVYSQANNAYLAANAAQTEANLVYSQANNAYSSANLAYAQANVANAQANNGIYIGGALVANNPNINFIVANSSNLVITGVSNTSPGNVTVSFDTRNPPGAGGGGGSVNVFANVGSVVPAIDNLVFLNTASILYLVTQNASETKGANVQSLVNTTLNLVSLNVSTNISNTGNLLVTQNTYTGNLIVAGPGVVTTTGNVTVNTFAISVNTITVASVSQVALDNFAATGAFATAKYLVQANCKSSYYVTEILVVNDGTNTYIDEYGTILTAGPVGTITAAIATGNVQLLFTANNTTSTVVQTVRYAIGV